MSRQTVAISRRRFVLGGAGAAAGLALGLRLPAAQAGAEEAAGAAEVGAWVLVSPDDTVTIRVVRSEMGQGTLTGLMQLVAEELECDWNRVIWEFPGPGESLARDRVWGSFSTGGSRGIRGSAQYVREGGAIARELLIAAAARRWGVPATECTARNSVVTHGASGRSATFGELALAASTLELPQQVTLKDPSEWHTVGRSVPRVDTRGKVTGELTFGADLSLPGMLHAAIHACPVHGGRRGTVNADKARAMPGVRAVLEVGEDAVAVVAESWWQAKKALETVTVEWQTGDLTAVNSATIRAMLEEGLGAEDAVIGNERGDALQAISKSPRTISADYSYPYQNHAPMEPMNATALWREDRCEAWVPTQNGETALQAVAEAAGLPPARCEVHKLLLGGGFGRRARHDFVKQAVQIARQLPGTPVKLLWSREEDMRRGYYHPITRGRLTASLDEKGNVEAMHVRIAGQSILAYLRPELVESRGMDPGVFQALMADGDHQFVYGIPRLLADHAMRNPHLRPGFWRGVNINQNVFYLESFIDELAVAAARDPLEFRRAMLGDNPKALAVLETVAEKAGWGRELPPGRGLGLAVCKAYGSYVAACAEVSVVDGRLRMHKLWAATDPGYAVNPQQIEAQVAGSFVYGLGAALYSECTVAEGRVEQENFDTYPAMTLAAMPEVDVTVMPSGGFWGGVGEPTIAVAAPAVLNGVYAATGVRIRELPVKDQALV
jgi:isoquinoline 1-oxidoreductase beta subunit